MALIICEALSPCRGQFFPNQKKFFVLKSSLPWPCVIESIPRMRSFCSWSTTITFIHPAFWIQIWVLPRTFKLWPMTDCKRRVEEERRGVRCWFLKHRKIQRRPGESCCSQCHRGLPTLLSPDRGIGKASLGRTPTALVVFRKQSGV